MPATSKKQFGFMEAVKHGGIKKKGLPPGKAAEFTDGVDYKSLPSKADPDADGDDDLKNPDESKEPKGKKLNAGKRKNRKVKDTHGLSDFIDRVKGSK